MKNDRKGRKNRKKNVLERRLVYEFVSRARPGTRLNGFALEHASPSLRNDAAVVKVAVTQDATALAFASHKLRCDPDVFETAMASQGSRYGWGDSPKRSPTKSSSMEFPAPLSPKAKDLVPSPQAKEPGVARQGSVVLEGSG